ncbi:MAG: hypothetical protein A2580_09350 [Hydrogenophilales bacterium RIFOXYD1_FULL_62_11]|nr:MAG: hypothetical protein A2580_09350 [Hydrogenophilales bacterium RIFOXYD1_FULL_62_11]
MQSTFIGMAVVALLGIALLTVQVARPRVTVYEGLDGHSERQAERDESGGEPRSPSLKVAEVRVAQSVFNGRRADVGLVEKSPLPSTDTNRVRYKRMRYAAYDREARERCRTTYKGKARETCIDEARMKYIR